MEIFVKAIKETGVNNISGGGGVMANSRLREKIVSFSENNNKTFIYHHQDYQLIMQQ